MANFDTFKVVSQTATHQKRVYVDEYKGKTYLHIREFYQDKNDGTFKPSPKGITFNFEAKEMQALKDAINAIAFDDQDE